MPQMAPMMWLILFIFFIFIFMLFNILNYFNFLKFSNKMKTTFFLNKNFKNSMFWKW